MIVDSGTRSPPAKLAGMTKSDAASVGGLDPKRVKIKWL